MLLRLYFFVSRVESKYADNNTQHLEGSQFAA